MMPKEISKIMILNLVDGYISGHLSARWLISSIDDLVGDDIVAGFALELREAVESFQDELAFYVADEATRRESSSYFGDRELLEKVISFRSAIERI